MADQTTHQRRRRILSCAQGMFHVGRQVGRDGFDQLDHMVGDVRHGIPRNRRRGFGVGRKFGDTGPRGAIM